MHLIKRGCELMDADKSLWEVTMLLLCFYIQFLAFSVLDARSFSTLPIIVGKEEVKSFFWAPAD